MDEPVVSDQEVEKLIKEEEVARQKVQEAMRHSSLAQTPEEKPKPVERPKKPEVHHEPTTPVVSIHKTTDDNTLVDVHVNNPLRRVVALLEEIKKQKAFSFTVRGSLGIMGVILTLSVFGIFGGGKVLCDKGLQTRTGTLRVLQLTEEHTDPDIPWSKAMLLKLFHVSTPITRQRVVLLSESESPIHLTMTLKDKPTLLNGYEVLATGTYNACSSTLSIPNEQSLELL